MDPTLYFYGGEMQLSQFAEQTGKSTDTIADWRKRGMLGRIGQPHPNREDRWVYVRYDVISVHIAGFLKDRGGYNWDVALSAGRQLVDKLFGWKQNFEHYHRYVFVLGTSHSDVVCHSDTDADKAFEALIPKNKPNLQIARVVDLEGIFAGLSAQDQENLNNLAQLSKVQAQ